MKYIHSYRGAYRPYGNIWEVKSGEKGLDRGKLGLIQGGDFQGMEGYWGAIRTNSTKLRVGWEGGREKNIRTSKITGRKCFGDSPRTEGKRGFLR